MSEEADIGVMMNMDFGSMKGLRRMDSYIFNIDELKNNLQHIMDQYIFDEGEFCVNISATTRSKLIRAYESLDDDMNKRIELEMIDVVPSETGDGSSISPSDANLQVASVYDAARRVSKEMEMCKDKEVIKNHLIIFDDAMDEIITLMRKDSLMRFYGTLEYETLSKDRKLSRV